MVKMTEVCYILPSKRYHGRVQNRNQLLTLDFKQHVYKLQQCVKMVKW